MSIIRSSLLLGAGAAAGPVQIERSLRFNSSDSAYLSRTPASAGNRKTWTWAGWVKRSLLGSSFQTIIGAGTGGNAEASIRFNLDDTLEFYVYTGGYNARLLTTQVFRDVSAWYHLVAVFDTPNATADQRIRLYVNGIEITTFSSRTNPTQNYDGYFNNSISHTIGDAVSGASPRFFNGYLADIYFIDGQALTPSSFTEVSATTGQLIPKAYTGSFGTNGFWLKFSDNSAATATTLGKDYSGNGNNWTPNNLSVAAGAGNDSLVDTPTSYGTDDSLGGSVRGNYCTLNSVDSPSGKTFSNGNLEVTSNDGNAYGTMAVSSGKWYWEVRSGGVQGEQIGIADANALTRNSFSTGGWSYDAFQGRKVYNNTYSGYGSALYNGDIVGIALNMDAGEITFYRNGVSQSVAFNTNISGKTIQPMLERGSGYSMSWVCNFGQRPFAYTAPSGFKALCDTSLPTPVVAKPSTVFDVALDTGANILSAAQNKLSTGTDLLWIKDRANANNHQLIDTVRGGTATLQSNTTSVETTYSAPSGSSVAWCWDAGSSTVTNTQGSITSSVRANASAGFSVVTFTGTGTTGTVGHGLGVAPSMYIIKRRDFTANWYVYHTALGNTGGLGLNLTNAFISSSNLWNNTSPTSSVLTVSSGSAEINANGGTYVLYCFAPVTGYSSGFSYTGNGSTDGVFVYLGLRAKLLLIKRTDTTGNWYLWDTVRNTYNVVGEELYPNLSNAAATATDLDILSNGFKMRSTAADFNASGGTYVGFAWAETPFVYSRAR